MTVPNWIQDAIFYQIFPDRFENGDPSLNPPNVKPWGSHPTPDGFQGGDLQGIINHLDYLKDLGINAIYLNPIFLSSSTHRYNATDYLTIDPKLGNLGDFRDLIKKAHHKHIRVILDGVFNHCGRGFFAFSDILENQSHSAYKEWFFIKKTPIDAYSPGEAVDYLGWWKHKSLPKLNTYNPHVRSYIMNVAKYWIDEGADGWRLDVPNEIDDDGFWEEFRMVVRKANPNAYLLGEIWNVDPRWVGDKHFDGLMNYPFRSEIINAVSGRLSPAEFGSKIEGGIKPYQVENNLAMYNLLGSHDTERFATLLNQNNVWIKQAEFLQFILPGVPAIYYGDEIGLTGGKDPECRKAFNWDQSQWNHEIYDWTKKLIKVRHSSIGLRRGKTRFLSFHDQPKVAGLIREVNLERMIALVNFSEVPAHLTIHLQEAGLGTGKHYMNVLDSRIAHPEEGKLHLSIPAKGQLLFQETDRNVKE